MGGGGGGGGASNQFGGVEEEQDNRECLYEKYRLCTGGKPHQIFIRNYRGERIQYCLSLRGYYDEMGGGKTNFPGMLRILLLRPQCVSISTPPHPPTHHIPLSPDCQTAE